MIEIEFATGGRMRITGTVDAKSVARPFNGEFRYPLQARAVNPPPGPQNESSPACAGLLHAVSANAR
jgi:hypothetical protein